MPTILRFSVLAGGTGYFTFVAALLFFPKDEALLVAWLVAMGIWFIVEKRIERREARKPMAPDSVITLDHVPGTDTFVADLAERRRKTQNVAVLASMLGWIAGALVLFALIALKLKPSLASLLLGFYAMGFAAMFLGQLVGSRRWAHEIPDAMPISPAQ